MAPGGECDPRERIKRGYRHPIEFSNTTAAALLLALSQLIDAGLLDEGIWRKLDGLLAIRDQSVPGRK